MSIVEIEKKECFFFMKNKNAFISKIVRLVGICNFFEEYFILKQIMFKARPKI